MWGGEGGALGSAAEVRLQTAPVGAVKESGDSPSDLLAGNATPDSALGTFSKPGLGATRSGPRWSAAAGATTDGGRSNPCCGRGEHQNRLERSPAVTAAKAAEGMQANCARTLCEHSGRLCP